MYFAFSLKPLNTNKLPKWWVYSLFLWHTQGNQPFKLKKFYLPPSEDSALFLGFSSLYLLGVGYVQSAAVHVTLWWLTGAVSQDLYVLL